MSHSHIRTPKPQPNSRRNIRVGTTILVLVIVGSAAVVAVIRWLNSNVSHVTAIGTVLETRIAAVGIGNSIYGGSVYFQVEARVKYRSESGDEVRWMPASEIKTSREALATRLAAHPKACYVAWDAKHPENPYCEFVPNASFP